MTKITIREIEYSTIQTEQAMVASLRFLWLFVELVDNEAYKKAETEKMPMRIVLDDFIKKAQNDIGSLFVDLVSSLCREAQAKEVEDYLRIFIPSLPEMNDPMVLTEACFAYITSIAKEGESNLIAEKELADKALLPATENVQVAKKSSKKKDGFGKKAEPELPTLEAIVSRETTPEDIAAVKVEGKLLEEAIATPLIPLPDSELAKLRPDLLTLEDQDIRSALAEQEANRLTVVSVPAPPDSDELEDLV